jgi:signal peptidase I
MSDQDLKPRHPVGLAAIALLLGAPALMLWMGRFKHSLLYFAFYIVAIFLGTYGAIVGFVPVGLFNGVNADLAKFVLALPVAIVAFFHALHLNKKTPLRPTYSRWFIALPAYTLLSLAAALLVRTFLYQPFSAPSASNFPNLMIGDMFFVSKTAYLSADPQRGDIAVFKLPSDPTIDYVKRVVGLPGDHIQMKEGRFYLNGVLVPREPVTYHPPIDQSDESSSSYYRETLPSGRSYVIAERSDDSDADNTDEYVVPEGHYFALGDNRDNSQDSRFLQQVGYIPRANFTGPYVLRFWNSSGVPLTGRPQETPATQK